ncbi:MAG: PilN domain-containing protein [Desulfobacterales bacterium]|nr:PilN domain-containing protein [Desulfobacterales bacterium]
MLSKEIFGIYLDDHELHFVCAQSVFGQMLAKKFSTHLNSVGIHPNGGLSGLKNFLDMIPPLRKRQIYLTLPRSYFFVRDIELPSMPKEDAILSIEQSLSVYAHLPEEEIYYDILLCERDDGRLNALIIYATRIFIDAYIDVFHRTGHTESLKAIFPISLAMGAWIRISGNGITPFALVLRQKGIDELAVFQKKGCLYSISWIPKENSKENELAFRSVVSKYPKVKDRIYHLDRIDRMTSPLVNETSEMYGKPNPLPYSNKKFKNFPSLADNWAVSILAFVTSKHQVISIDSQPVRLSLIKPVPILLGMALILFGALSVYSWQFNQEIIIKQNELAAIKKEIKEIQNQLKPMEDAQATLMKSEKSMTDVETFMKGRPTLYTFINEIARVVPEKTWFNHFGFEKKQLSLKGESKDALVLQDALKKLGIFAQVNLVGSVTKTRDGADRFSIEIELK